MPEIPEDFTHAQLWMKYKAEERKVKEAKKIVERLWVSSQSHLLSDELNKLDNILNSTSSTKKEEKP